MGLHAIDFQGVLGWTGWKASRCGTVHRTMVKFNWILEMGFYTSTWKFRFWNRPSQWKWILRGARMAHAFITIRTKDHLRLSQNFYGLLYFSYADFQLYLHSIHNNYALNLGLSQVTFHLQKCVVLYFIHFELNKSSTLESVLMSCKPSTFKFKGKQKSCDTSCNFVRIIIIWFSLVAS